MRKKEVEERVVWKESLEGKKVEEGNERELAAESFDRLGGQHPSGTTFD